MLSSQVARNWTADVTTVVVVPCYNEESRLDTAAFLAFAEDNASVGVLFVNDGSTDGTEGVLRSLAARAPGRLAFLSLAKNGGKAEAVREGINDAMKSGASYVGYWDADLATGLDQIIPLRRELEQDPDRIAVLGSRVQLLGRTMDRSPARHYTGRVFATVASLVLSLPVYDTQCGAKLFRVGPEVVAAFRDRFHSRWSFDVEILARLCLALGPRVVEQRVVEYPLPLWRDVAGSKLNLAQMVGAFLDLLLIRRRYARPR